MVRVAAKGLRHDLVELRFNLVHGLAWCEPGAIADTEDVGVDCKSFFAKGGIEHDIGGLPADARQSLQLVTRAWHLALMIVDEGLRQGDDVFRLGIEQPDGLNRLAQPVLAKSDHLLGRFHVGE